MPRVSLLGGAYSARSVIAAAQRQLNLYSEEMPQAVTQGGYKSGATESDPSPAALYPAAGLRTLLTLPTMPVRGIHTCTSGQVYAVGGSTIYAISPAWVATALGTITDSLTTPVGMADNGLQLVVVDGTTGGWTITLAGNAYAAISDPTGTFVGADKVDYLDTFFLFNSPGTPQFYMSDSEAVTFTALNFAGLSSVSDLLVTLIVAKREVWLLGTKSAEIWYDYGNDGSGTVTTGGASTSSFPFQRVPGVFVDRGIGAKYSLASTDNAVYWLQQDRYGQGIILEGGGYQATRISTYAIEYELSTYPLISDAIGFCYSLAGHAYYVLSFPAADKTWCYDITTKLWHELCWIDAFGVEHRHRAMCATFANGLVVCGDWSNGNIYCLDPNVYTDFGGPIKRLRGFPHLLNNGSRAFYRQFLADFDAGTAPGLTTDPDADDIYLDWSDDRGHSFGNPVPVSMGALGAYNTSLQWQRLGYARDRCFRLTWSTPNNVALQGAWIDVTPSQS